jgi:hypothetical protein
MTRLFNCVASVELATVGLNFPFEVRTLTGVDPALHPGL